MADNNDLCLLGIDPLLNVDIKLFVKDILSLVPVSSLKGFFKFYQHVIQYAEICGCIVGVEWKGTSTVYTVDDGTGTIECTFESSLISKDYPPGLGECVRAGGRINDFRDNRELRGHALATMNPNDELMHNVQVLGLKKEYQKPFEIPAEFRTRAKDLENLVNEEEKILGIAKSDMHERRMDTNAFCDALLSFLKSRFPNEAMFSATSPISDDRLKGLAKEALLNSEYLANPTLKQVSQYIFQNIRQLEAQGHIVIANQKGQLYKVVDEGHLKEAVLRIIQELLDSKTHFIGGVLEEYIATRIKIESDTSLSDAKVVKLLKDMVDQSYIYQCAPGEYQTIQ